MNESVNAHTRRGTEVVVAEVRIVKVSSERERERERRISMGNVIKRYERWNPVHPTCGALWGLGIGVGCGVGWGPGFGPEVVGYVGAGCGLGFSVGITFVGFGIGLPLPAISSMTSGMFQFAKHSAVPAVAQISEIGQLIAISCTRRLCEKKSLVSSTLGPWCSLAWKLHDVDAEDVLEVELENFNHCIFENASKALEFTCGKLQGCLHRRTRNKLHVSELETKKCK